MIDESLASRPCPWLALGAEAGDVVISTRVRLARNVRGYPMPWKMSADQRDELEEMLGTRLGQAELEKGMVSERVDALGPRDRQLLVERHLISRELSLGNGRRAVHFSRDEHLAIMTDEEDHLRLQALAPGLQVDSTWSYLNGIDSRIEKLLPYAVSEELGYLTCCPTNVGTGLRVSVMIHVPTLVSTGQITKVATAAAKVGLVLRGFRGEGSEATGDLYQISNQVTLGRSESEILGDVRVMVDKVVEWERGLRKLLLRQSRNDLEDRVWRAWGQLRFARKMGTEEALGHLSSLRLGIHVELLHHLRPALVNELFLLIQPAHLQALVGRELDREERDRQRAAFVRRRLSEAE
ncbi:MAG: protein arginine kinase [Planctomycetota bacterium]